MEDDELAIEGNERSDMYGGQRHDTGNELAAIESVKMLAYLVKILHVKTCTVIQSASRSASI